jgi:large subunit ribosomal protein L9e
MVSEVTPLSLLSIVKVTIKARVVTVKGSRGTIIKDLSHMAVEMQIMKQKTEKRKGNFIRLRMWFGHYKQRSQIKTCTTLISNMFSGVVEVSATLPSYPPHSLIQKRGWVLVSFSLLSACQFY